MRRPSSGRRETRRGAPFYKVKFVFDTQEPASRWALLFGETKTESPPGGQAMRTYCPLSRGSRTTWPMLPQATTLMANGLNDLRERDRHHSCMTGSGKTGPSCPTVPRETSLASETERWVLHVAERESKEPKTRRASRRRMGKELEPSAVGVDGGGRVCSELGRGWQARGKVCARTRASGRASAPGGGGQGDGACDRAVQTRSAGRARRTHAALRRAPGPQARHGQRPRSDHSGECVACFGGRPRGCFRKR